METALTIKKEKQTEKSTNYDIHEFCRLFPDMPEEEYKALKEDIASNGLLEPVIIYQDKILDGKNRYRACMELGIEPKIIEFNGDEISALNFVISKNLKRRHLSQSQKAALAVEILPLIEKYTREKKVKAGVEYGVLGGKYGFLGGRGITKESEKYQEKKNPLPAILQEGGFNLSTHLQTNIDSPKENKNRNNEATAIAGKMVGVGSRYVSTAKKVAEKSPLLVEKVKLGVISLPDAEKIIRKVDSEETALKVVNSIETGKINKVEDAIKQVTKEKKAEEIQTIQIQQLTEQIQINNVYCADIREIKLPQESIDLIFTDPPYHDEYLELYEETGKLAQQCLKPEGYLLVYAGKMYLPEIINTLKKYLNYIWTLGIVFPGSQLKIQKYHFFDCWRAILVFKKTEKVNHSWVPDVATGKRDKTLHEWQQSLEPALQYIKAFSKEGDTVLDPFAGSGTTVIACLQLNRNFIAFDKDENAVKITLSRIKNFYESTKNY